MPPARRPAAMVGTSRFRPTWASPQHLLLGVALVLLARLSGNTSSAAADASFVSTVTPRAVDPDTALVQEHVKSQAPQTFRQPMGKLRYPYLVPAGPYADTCWDWDSLFMGVAMLDQGSLPYFAGSFLNFLALTNVSNGEVQGCVTTSGATGTIYHAKPVLIQGGWLAARRNASGLLPEFRQYKPAMEALLAYWDRAPQKDAATGLRVWHDQLQTGADNLVTSQCPSSRSPCWNNKTDAFTLAAVDLHVFLYREHMAYAKFCDAWAAMPDVSVHVGSDLDTAEHGRAALRAEAALHRGKADDILSVMQRYLWDGDAGVYVARNVSTGAVIPNRVYLMAFPLWGGLTNASQAASIVDQAFASDMASEYGIRSTSSKDPRYSNANEIKPYSNWRGPMWVNVNAVIAYGMATQYGGAYAARAQSLAAQVVHTLAQDLRVTSTWHECYSSEDGSGLAAAGFLSWDTLGATLVGNVAQGLDPFAL